MAQAIYELDPIGVDGALEAVAIHWYCNEGCASLAKIEGPTSTGENNDAEYGAVCETCGKEIDTTVTLADVMDAPHAFFKAVYSEDCVCDHSKASPIHVSVRAAGPMPADNEVFTMADFERHSTERF